VIVEYEVFVSVERAEKDVDGGIERGCAADFGSMRRICSTNRSTLHNAEKVLI
jgi:hypothetical protein